LITSSFKLCYQTPNPLFLLTNYPEFLDFIPRDQATLTQFYNCFANYQYLYADQKIIAPDYAKRSYKGIHIQHQMFNFNNSKEHMWHDILQNCHNVTEIFSPFGVLDCLFLVEYYPQIEILEVQSVSTVEQLKNMRLKFLRLNGQVNTEEIIQNLPDTIESLIILTGHHTSAIFDQLIKFPHLNYLKINLFFGTLSTSLNINTIHFILDTYDYIIRIDIPNIKNIIITHNKFACQEKKLYLKSQNAITCRIYNMFQTLLSLKLPNCSDPKLLMPGKYADTKQF
jgi:hypothetical protein